MIDFTKLYPDDNEGEMTMDCDAIEPFSQKACSVSDSWEGEWQECIDHFKDEGWKVRNVNGEWKHFCPAHAKLN